jgi:homospermidine synthase
VAGRNWKLHQAKTIVRDEIVRGRDELGVLLMGHSNDRDWAYWHGSQLTIDQARALCPFNSATSLQVAAPDRGRMAWALENRGGAWSNRRPAARAAAAMIRPYLANVVRCPHGTGLRWQDRRTLFDEPLVFRRTLGIPQSLPRA